VTELRKDLPELPAYMKHLPLDERGYPVPWFVASIDGKPDFRVVRNINDIPAEAVAHRAGTCWICGHTLGAFKSFVAGPMCAVNLTSGEPPCHLSCATFAARACPFLAKPKAKRREANLPDDGIWKEGGLTRNPGVAMVWTTKRYEMNVQEGSAYFVFGAPEHVEFWAEGERASREQVEASIDSGLPMLIPMLEDTGISERKIDKMVKAAMDLVPA
jgi:hypothetical protein